MAVESPFSWPSVLESGLVFIVLCRSRCGLSITFVLELNIRPSPLLSPFLPIMLTLEGGEKAGIGILRRCRRPVAKKEGESMNSVFLTKNFFLKKDKIGTSSISHIAMEDYC